MRPWTFLFAALTAVLCATLALVVRENRRLREQLVAMAATKARESGLEEGQVLGPVTLRDADGAPIAVRYEGEASGTVLLFHSSSCDACEATLPLWRRAVEETARFDVRVFCIQTDVTEGVPMALEGLPASLAVPLPPVGWLASLPAVPATLLVDDLGVLTRAWYGELDAEMAADMTGAIQALKPRTTAPSPQQ